MGSKPNLPSPDSHAARPGPSSNRAPVRKTALKALAIALFSAAATLFSSCISDGPNKTGGDYLAQHGIILKDSLIHVVLKDFPVDSIWTTDGLIAGVGESDLRHLGDSVLLAGRSGGFTAEPRMSYQITDTAMIDTLAKFDSASLRLCLSFHKSGNGFDQLKALLADAGVRDTMAFEVSAWDSTNAGLSNTDWGTSLARFHDKFLNRQDDSGALPAPSARDTIVLRLKNAYTTEEFQARSLPNLYKSVVKAPSNRHFIHLRLTPIKAANSDSGAAMLRLGGWLGDGTAIPMNPVLLFGDSAALNTSKASTKNRLQPILTSSVTRAVTYALRYSGSDKDILTEKQRGLHMVIDRAALMARIDSQVYPGGKPAGAGNVSGDFDLTYFVPFAKLTVPVDNPKLEGGFPLQMILGSEIDSLLGDTVNGGIRIDQIASESRKDIWYTYEPGRPETVFDRVSLGYDVVEQGLRMVTLRYSRDSASNDTLYIRTGETKEWIANLTGYGQSYLTMSLEAGNTSLTVRSYLTVRWKPEVNTFKDKTTGQTIEDLKTLLPHFLKPGDSGITLRATRGFQQLLNRVQAGAKILGDFTIQPASNAAVDTASNLKVSYPVLSVVPPKLVGGKLLVDIELYLFPLKAR